MKLRTMLFLGIGLGFGIVVGLGILLWGLQGLPNPLVGAAPKMGELPPDFELQDLTGQTVRRDDLQGHPVLLNFWGTWCGPCALEMPIFQHYARLHPNLRVVAVNADEELAVVKAYASKWNLDFTILLDPGQKTMTAYSVVGLPTSFFLDAEGRLQAVHVGGVTDAQLIEYFKRIGISE